MSVILTALILASMGNILNINILNYITILNRFEVL